MPTFVQRIRVSPQKCHVNFEEGMDICQEMQKRRGDDF